MPVNGRATIFFDDIIGYGWSETYFTDFFDNLADVRDAAFRLATARRNLLAANVFVEEVRVSDDDVKRDSFVQAFQVADQTNPTDFGEAEAAFEALLLRIEAGSPTRRPLYLRGLPDRMVGRNGQFTAEPLWEAAFTRFKNILIRGGRSPGWGIKAFPKPVPIGLFIDTVTQIPGTGRLLINTTVAHGFNKGNVVIIRGFRGAPFLNGRHVVVDEDGALSFSIACKHILGTPGGVGTVQLYGQTIQAITSCQYERVTHRITGLPFVRFRGRRSGR